LFFAFKEVYHGQIKSCDAIIFQQIVLVNKKGYVEMVLTAILFDIFRAYFEPGLNNGVIIELLQK